MNEFDLIQKYFQPLSVQRKEVLVGIGDDAACIAIPSGMSLLVSTDTLVSGVHFLATWSAYDIAYRALMVNISDLAAMAAEPCWCTLALTLPKVDESWLESFTLGLKDVMNPLGIDLVGGDTTQGPLAISMTMMGLAPINKAIQRSGAQPGDCIFVSGPLGAAALAVQSLSDQKTPHSELMDKLLHPKARVDLIPYLRQYATSAVDISDGLSADLNHVCTASKVGACLTAEALPMHPLLSQHLGAKAMDLTLNGGDDYELCFTVPASKKTLFLEEIKAKGLRCYPIGVIEEKPGLRMIQGPDGQCTALSPRGYRHF